MTSITIMNILLFLMPYLLETIIGYNADKRKYVQLIYKLHDAPYGRCDQSVRYILY